MVNEWTRADLPDAYAAYSRILRSHCGDLTPSDMCSILDLVLEHLNRAHPKPEPMSADSTYGIPREDYAYVDWPATCAAANERADRAESDRDRWRRAHEIVEQERDQARQAHREAWKHLDAAADRVVHEQTRAEDAERDRDEWRSRAEAAEARLADPYSQVNQDAAAWKRVAAHPALKIDLLPEADHTYAGGVFERITWLAEAAKARTAPAVTRAGVKNAIDTCFALAPKINTQVISDAVCDFLGVEAEPADPVEEKARELYRAATPDAQWETVANEYRRIAAHILRQEEGDE